ncbi:RHS repeat domain-containing protein [Cellvibrio japonicus]|uniref:RHS repeat domain-containing protein n=1 Tax=Cellvibrio japonicus TaxID=155077 RepID=UPI0013052506|nr:RHS repeat-associated core domain-containing protein [Cellvibrio japonicus]
MNLIETETRPAPETTQYNYNRDRQLTEIKLPSGETLHYIYQEGRLAHLQTPEGDTHYRYQQGDQLHEIQQGSEKVNYSYDGTLLTQQTYQGQLNATINFGYNTDFRVNNLSYAGGNTSLSYDKDGLLTGIHGFTIEHHPNNGLPQRLSRGQWNKNWQWNAYGETISVNYRWGSQANFGYDLEYNLTGQIVRKTEYLPDGSTATFDYTYDNRYRLTEVKRNNEIVEAYGYDANGNRTLHTSVDMGITNQSATYTQGDQLQNHGNTTYLYDANGRLGSKLKATDDGLALTTYIYGSQGQLLQVDTPDKSIRYLHNALGNRVAKLVNGTVTEQYLWQDLTTLLAIYDGSGNLKQRFEYTLGHTPTSFTQNNQRYFIHTDHLGSPRIITDSNGNIVKTVSYDSYGNIIEDSNPEFQIPFGFAGGLKDDDTGLIRFGYRDYDPETGRWTARDPIGFEGGDTNLYGYVLGDPINWVDIDGLAPAWVGPVAAVTAVVGGALIAYGGPVAPFGLGLVLIAGGLTIWDWATTPEEQIKEIQPKLDSLQEKIDKLQDAIDKANSCH